MKDDRAPDDLELFEQWQQGDQNAGNELLKRHFRTLYRFFANKVDSDVDELIQATFLTCLRIRQNFRKQSSFRTYLFGIAQNELFGHYRRRKRNPENLDFSVTSVIDMGISPTSRLARHQRYGLLMHALRSLPVEQQILLELYYWEELSITELSETLAIAETATRARLTRARRALRKQLGELSGTVEPHYDRLDDLDSWARSVRGKRANGPPAG